MRARRFASPGLLGRGAVTREEALDARGVMRLDELPVRCTRADCCGFDCNRLAVAWDDDGEGYCEEHRP